MFILFCLCCSILHLHRSRFNKLKIGRC
uniref:Uncharacterized protein n=1 Tax=Arundo donax TaxID=35708 RepID=A0A0A9CBX7_ARUDO